MLSARLVVLLSVLVAGIICEAANALLISSNNTGRAAGNRGAGDFALSPDGRYVAFISQSTDLENCDTNTTADLFWLDHLTGIRKCITGSVPNPTRTPVQMPLISNDGRIIAFLSRNTNFVSGVPGASDPYIYIYDTQSSAFTFIGVGPLLYQNEPSTLSSDGRYITFRNGGRIYRRNLVTGVTENVNVATNGTSSGATFSQSRGSTNGRFFIYASETSGIVPQPEKTNRVAQVYWRDMESNITKLVSVATNGDYADGDAFVRAFSRDGRYAVFRSTASNLVSGIIDKPGHDLFLRDMVTDQTWCVTLDASGNATTADLILSTFEEFSGDGSALIFARRRDSSPLSEPQNVYVHFLGGRTNLLVTTNTPGSFIQLNGNGRYALFLTSPSPFTLQVCDLLTLRSAPLSQPNFRANLPSPIQITDNGRSTVFVSSMIESINIQDTNSASDIFVAPTISPKIERAFLEASSITVTATAFPDDIVRLQGSSDLTDWQDIASATVTSEGRATLQAPREVTFNRFYRLVSP